MHHFSSSNEMKCYRFIITWKI